MRKRRTTKTKGTLHELEVAEQDCLDDLLDAEETLIALEQAKVHNPEAIKEARIEIEECQDALVEIAEKNTSESAQGDRPKSLDLGLSKDSPMSMPKTITFNITENDIEGAVNKYNANPVARCAHRMGYKGAYAGAYSGTIYNGAWVCIPNKFKKRNTPAWLHEIHYSQVGDALHQFLTDFKNEHKVEPCSITISTGCPV